MPGFLFAFVPGKRSVLFSLAHHDDSSLGSGCYFIYQFSDCTVLRQTQGIVFGYRGQHCIWMLLFTD